ncbi:MAG: hypothetical protein CM1200mP30_28240 [Pseudomonadota bacterium]|nr:MAG: hypothetical protein CM1200mP30_28240 [Pseudomonadota bacterium]
MYVLDEPTIGLHPRDTGRYKTLKQLRDRGNSVIMVEHDFDTIRQADHLNLHRAGGRPLGGRISHLGVHQKLLLKKNSHRTIFKRQKIDFSSG